MKRPGGSTFLQNLMERRRKMGLPPRPGMPPRPEVSPRPGVTGAPSTITLPGGGTQTTVSPGGVPPIPANGGSFTLGNMRR